MDRTMSGGHVQLNRQHLLAPKNVLTKRLREKRLNRVTHYCLLDLLDRIAEYLKLEIINPAGSLSFIVYKFCVINDRSIEQV